MAGEDSNGSVRISMRDVYDEVVGLRGDVTQLRNQVATVAERVPDHEQRIRGLERWAYSLPAAFLLSCGSLLIALLRR